MLRAQASLESLLSIAEITSQASSEERWQYLVGKVKEETEQQKRCRQLVESHYLSRLHRARGPLCNERHSDKHQKNHPSSRLQCTVNRLQRQIQALVKVAGGFIISTETQDNRNWLQRQRKSQRKQRGCRHTDAMISGIDY